MLWFIVVGLTISSVGGHFLIPSGDSYAASPASVHTGNPCSAQMGSRASGRDVKNKSNLLTKQISG